jgi:hypothetical protein
VTLPNVPLPAYRFPLRFLARWLWTALVLRRGRNLGVDGLELFAGRLPRARVEGVERLPSAGPCVLVMNHYERPGLRVWWGVALVTAAVWQRRGDDPPVRWLMADRFRRFRLGPLPLPDALTAWGLALVARAYGMLLVARVEEEQALRSGALLEARRELRRGGVLGVTPEAAAHGGPELYPPWPNSAVALAWLSRGETPLVAVAFHDDDAGRLVARFGRPFTIDWPGLDEARAHEIELGDRVMGALAELLPPRLRGRYGGAHARDAVE